VAQQPDGEDRFTIYVRTMTSKVLELEVQASYSISALKEKLQELEGIPAAEQKLVHSGKPLESGTLGDHSIMRPVTIHLALRQRAATAPTPRQAAAETPTTNTSTVAESAPVKLPSPRVRL
jgi:hypothetical protein